MDPLCLCYKVSNLLCFINPFTLQRAEINVEKFNNAPFRAIMSSKQLVEYTVLDVSYNPQRGAEGAGKRRFQLEEVTVCRSDRIGEDDAIVVTNTHLGALLHEGDTVLGYDLSTAVFNDDDLKPMKVGVGVWREGQGREMPDCVLVRKCYPNFRKLNKHRNWKLRKLDMEEAESNRKVNNSKEDEEYEQFKCDLEEDEEMRKQVNIYKEEGAREIVVNEEVEKDAPIIPLTEMLEDLNLDEEVQGDDMVVEGSSEEEN